MNNLHSALSALLIENSISQKKNIMLKVFTSLKIICDEFYYDSIKNIDDVT